MRINHEGCTVPRKKLSPMIIKTIKNICDNTTRVIALIANFLEMLINHRGQALRKFALIREFFTAVFSSRLPNRNFDTNGCARDENFCLSSIMRYVYLKEHKSRENQNNFIMTSFYKRQNDDFWLQNWLLIDVKNQNKVS